MLTQEELLVAEIEKIGIHYLSRQTSYEARQIRPPQHLLVDLLRQPSSRVRTSVIAVLLAHPEYAQVVPQVLPHLALSDQVTLKLFYTAAVFLQRQHAERLKTFLARQWKWLPDLFSVELGLTPDVPPEDTLYELGLIHRSKTGVMVNWTGTYQNVAHHLLRRWELEQQWNP
ncbi:MAG: hypothetical protein JXB07_16250 [Anaerolineae bacterium]|nr:hypothetical protein [Anaerolineae bacterium]